MAGSVIPERVHDDRPHLGPGTGKTTPLRSHIGVIDTVRISADGKVVLTASGHDGSTRGGMKMTGEQLTVFPWRMQEVNVSDGRLVLFSPKAFDNAKTYPQLYFTRAADLLALSRTRVTRTLTCPSAVDSCARRLTVRWRRRSRCPVDGICV